MTEFNNSPGASQSLSSRTLTSRPDSPAREGGRRVAGGGGGFHGDVFCSVVSRYACVQHGIIHTDRSTDTHTETGDEQPDCAGSRESGGGEGVEENRVIDCSVSPQV